MTIDVEPVYHFAQKMSSFCFWTDDVQAEASGNVSEQKRYAGASGNVPDQKRYAGASGNLPEQKRYAGVSGNVPDKDRLKEDVFVCVL